MSEHSCPDCGLVHGHAEPDGDETDAGAEAMAEAAAEIAREETEQRRITEEGTSEQARIHEEAETERRRIEAEALVEMARIQAEAAAEISEDETDAAEAIAHEETEQIEAIVGAEPGPEGAGEELPAEEDLRAGDEELEELPAEEEGASEAPPVAVVVPPQLADEAAEARPRSTSGKRTNAFRARRVRSQRHGR
jgi:hypothetical protein